MKVRITYDLDVGEINEALSEWVRRKTGQPLHNPTFNVSVDSNDIRKWRAFVSSNEDKQE